ncbi:MAG: FmdB family zinc ribbon protein [Dehalococcoidia bacterium]|jgi:predicted nucleic acid-binding Zn ribbon protein
MPTYEYECSLCHNRFDKRQGFNDEPIAICPQCKGSSQRVFHAVPIVFKGSGFYCTDHGHGNRYDSPKTDKATDKKEEATGAKKEPAKKGGNGSSESSKEPSTTVEKKPAASKVESTSSKS